MFSSRFVPCEECGASVDRYAAQPHRCDARQRADYQMFMHRDEIAGFEDAFTEYLGTTVGRFETFLAMRRVRYLR